MDRYENAFILGCGIGCVLFIGYGFVQGLIF